jgi:type IV fimbrial biogenesis protein FimT
MPRVGGLTLIELLVTLALVAIIAVSGVPAFANLILDIRMTSRINRLVHGVHLANHAAHRSMTTTTLCKSTDGLHCNPAGRWSDGWIVFIGGGEDAHLLDVGQALHSVAIKSNRDAFVFRPFETRSTNGTLTFCDRRGADRARAVVVSYTGRPRVNMAPSLECEHR